MRDLEGELAQAQAARREAEEALRKVQLELVTTRDQADAARAELQAMAKKIMALESGKGTPRASDGPPTTAENAERLGRRVADLRELLAEASVELSQLHADEVVLGAKRARVLSDACALLARAIGNKGEVPPPVPSAGLATRMSLRPVVDISEVAEALQSMRPPASPKVD